MSEPSDTLDVPIISRNQLYRALAAVRDRRTGCRCSYGGLCSACGATRETLLGLVEELSKGILEGAVALLAEREWRLP